MPANSAGSASGLALQRAGDREVKRARAASPGGRDQRFANEGVGEGDRRLRGDLVIDQALESASSTARSAAAG